MDNKEKFIQLLIILLGLFVFIFFTRSYYSDLIGNTDLNTEKNKTYNEKLKELDFLSKTKKELKNKSKNYETIKKYLEPVSDDKIISEIYSIAENKVVGVKVLSLSMTEGVKNELGFQETKLNIFITATNKEAIKDFLDYLVKDSKYKIFINSFNMPKKTTAGYKLNIPATIFYVDSNNNN